MSLELIESQPDETLMRSGGAAADLFSRFKSDWLENQPEERVGIMARRYPLTEKPNVETRVKPNPNNVFIEITTEAVEGVTRDDLLVMHQEVTIDPSEKRLDKQVIYRMHVVNSEGHTYGFTKKGRRALNMVSQIISERPSSFKKIPLEQPTI